MISFTIIVTTTYRDPIEGYTDNLYGLNGVVIGAGVGVLRILFIDNDKYADIVPADVVVNSTLAVAWWTYSNYKLVDNFFFAKLNY